MNKVKGKMGMTDFEITSDVSINPMTGMSYPLPGDGDDRQGIEDFLSRNHGKPVVVVQGLGFVGSAMSIVCANALTCDYAVLGVDLATPDSYWKIRSINEGTLPLKSSDPKMSTYFDRAQEKGCLYATFDEHAYARADVIIVDVNLDVQKKVGGNQGLLEYDVDIEPFSRAIRAIGRNCKENVLVLVETTVPPGTCENVVKSILVEELSARDLPTDKFKLGHSYERVMPGPQYIDSIQNFYRVYAGIDEASADATETFLKTIIHTNEYPLSRLARTNATEMAKVLENSYRAMNIAFMVEWSRFAEEAGVNLYEVVNAIRMRDTHNNMMFPGIGVGGYCLTKDPLLASWARQRIFDSNEELTQSVQGVYINDQMPQFAFEYLKQQVGSKKLSDSKVLLLGVSYRGDVGDTRYSPVEPFCKLLIDAGSDVRLHDYFVDNWRELGMTVETELENALAGGFDILVISAGHSGYRQNKQLLTALSECSNCLVFDAIGLLSGNELEEIRRNNRALVLGRGDSNL
jgi:nucleotide sugar dehydrogenase